MICAEELFALCPGVIQQDQSVGVSRQRQRTPDIHQVRGDLRMPLSELVSIDGECLPIETERIRPSPLCPGDVPSPIEHRRPSVGLEIRHCEEGLTVCCSPFVVACPHPDVRLYIQHLRPLLVGQPRNLIQEVHGSGDSPLGTG